MSADSQSSPRTEWSLPASQGEDWKLLCGPEHGIFSNWLSLSHRHSITQWFAGWELGGARGSGKELGKLIVVSPSREERWKPSRETMGVHRPGFSGHRGIPKIIVVENRQHVFLRGKQNGNMG